MKAPSEVNKAIRKTKAALEFERGGRYSTKIKRYARSIDVTVYPKSVARALLLMKQVLAGLHGIGAVPKIRGARYWIHYEGRFFKFFLREATNQSALYDNTFTTPYATGKLELAFYPPVLNSWYDHRLPDNGVMFSETNGEKLEKRIDEIVAAIPMMLKGQLEKEKKESEEAAIQAEKSRLRAIEQAKKNSAKINFSEIMKAHRLWRRSRELSEFLAEMENRVPEPRSDDAETWIGLCRQVIDALDPFKGGAKPWEKLVRAEHDGRKVAFVSLDRLDPQDELAAILDESKSEAGGVNSSPWRWWKNS